MATTKVCDCCGEPLGREEKAWLKLPVAKNRELRIHYADISTPNYVVGQIRDACDTCIRQMMRSTGESQ